MKKGKIAFIIGTRAELIKSFPIMLELQKQKRDYYFIHTGQHNLGNLCDTFSVKRPEFVLSKEPNKESKFWSKINSTAVFWMINTTLKVRSLLKELKDIAYVVYHGDTMSTTVAAIGSSRLLNGSKKYKNVHLEGGLRSGSLNEPFPEEISRKIADYFSDIILAVSERSCKNVEHYKKRGRLVCLTGNSVIDSIYHSYELAKKRKVKPLSKEKFALISIHRHENINNRKRMKRILDILNYLKIESYWTMHDNTKKQLEKFGLLREINKNIKVIPTQDYVSFSAQIKKASLIICDGGSMQEESLVFHIPCILLRNKTERQEGLESNFQSLVGTDVKLGRQEIEKYSSKNFKIKQIKNPYGEKGVSKKVVRFLR